MNPPHLQGPPCGRCRHLDPKEINPGTAYCRETLVWRGADVRVLCPFFKVIDDG